MTFELGGYSFGNTPRTAGGGHGPTAQAIRDVLESVPVAEEAGLDFFGFGEHHTGSMPLSPPTALVNTATASTQRIGLGTTVTVLSTDEPIRVFQQLATAAAIAPGPIEAVAGRGSSPITFPIFDLDERGLWLEPLGIAAAAGLVAYFIGAITGHLRVGDTKNLTMPLPPLVLSIAVLASRLVTA